LVQVFNALLVDVGAGLLAGQHADNGADDVQRADCADVDNGGI
jgi:hypothetical protein